MGSGRNGGIVRISGGLWVGLSGGVCGLRLSFITFDEGLFACAADLARWCSCRMGAVLIPRFINTVNCVAHDRQENRNRYGSERNEGRR